MDRRDVVPEENRAMAEAVVESPATRFFCHKCSLEISPVLPDYICPRCQGGFIEEVAQPEPSEESDEDYGHGIDGNDDVDAFAQVADLWNMISYMRRPDDVGGIFQGGAGAQERDGGAAHLSRPGPSRRRYGRIRSRRPGQDADTVRSRTEGFLQQLVSSLTENAGLTNAGFPVFLNLHSNPGDYAWGRGGWNAIITQLINQLDGTGPPPLPKDKIDEIPTVTICKDQVDKNLQCTVCMEDFIEEEPVRRLTCEHHFHDSCIIPWLELHGTCPICRKLLNDSSNQDMFSSNSPIADDHIGMVNVMPGPSQPENNGLGPARRNDSSSFNPHSVYDFTDEFD